MSEEVAADAVETTDGVVETRSDVISDAAPVVETTPDVNEAFSVPEEYRDTVWAKKINSEADVYKQLDGLNKVVSKKVVGNIDYATASPEEISEHHAKLAPQNASDYSFGENADPELSKAYGEVFQKNGLTKHQGDNITSEITEILAAQHQQMQEQTHNVDSYKDMFAKEFGEGFQKIGQEITQNLQKFSNPEDMKLFEEGVDNETRMAIDRTMNNFLKAYGANEGSGGSNNINAGSDGAGDLDGQISDMYTKIKALDRQPNHTTADRKDLTTRLQKLLAQKGNK